ncbi:MAG: TIR domain-containing protein [Bacteroidales bacterium]|nr:TIR domain-containing protein [Bacteroidales bacterium]
MKVFLGGTVNGSKWRDYVISRLKIDYFNPVVENWDESAMAIEIEQRAICDYCLYVLTPKMSGYYAIAEIVDDSYKKTDKTIFCYLTKDEDCSFSQDEIDDLKKLGEKISANGSLFFNNLDNAIEYLNSPTNIDFEKNQDSYYKNVFISYGRRHSKSFVRKLYGDLTAKGYSVWLDQNNIPLGVDFQEQIDTGIRQADNFIYVVSPHSVKSEYCNKEIILAKQYNKRIIPLMHVEPADCWDKMDPEIQKLNWINIRQKEDFSKELEDWEYIDSYNDGLDGIIKVLENNKDYTSTHTLLLDKALDWQQKHYSNSLLLLNKKRKDSIEWLLKKKFTDNSGNFCQPPCLPCDIQCKFITESRKHSELGMTDVFISCSATENNIANLLISKLDRSCITSSLDPDYMSDNEVLDDDTKNTLANADTFICILTKKLIKSERGRVLINLAKEYCKKIIVLLSENLPPRIIPFDYSNYCTIDFYDRSEIVETSTESGAEADVIKRRSTSPLQKSINLLEKQISENEEFYTTGKKILVNAIRWKKYKNDGMIIVDDKLEKAKAWLKLAQRNNIQVNDIISEYIEESQKKAAGNEPEVYISYNNDDFDETIIINNELYCVGKSSKFIEKDKINSCNIENNINTCKNFVRIISESYINCSENIQESEIAEKNHKRIISVIFSDCSESTRKKYDSDHSLLIDRYNIRNGISDLIRILDSDRDYINRHNKYSNYANNWLNNNKDNSLLLRGNELILAEDWLKHSYGIDDKETLPDLSTFATLTPQKQPSPTQTQYSFIIESKIAIEQELMHKKRLEDEKAAKERENLQMAQDLAKQQAEAIKKGKRFIAALIIGFIACGITTIIAINSHKTANNARIVAEYEKLKADSSRILADSALVVANQEKANALQQQIAAKTQANFAQIQKEKAEKEKVRARIAQEMAEKERKNAEEKEQRSYKLVKSLLEREDYFGNIFDIDSTDLSRDDENYYAKMFYRSGLNRFNMGDYENAILNYSLGEFINNEKDQETKLLLENAKIQVENIKTIESVCDSLLKEGHYAEAYRASLNIKQINPGDQTAEQMKNRNSNKLFYIDEKLFGTIRGGTFATSSLTEQNPESNILQVNIQPFEMLNIEVTNQMIVDYLNVSNKEESYINNKNSLPENKIFFNKELGYWQVEKGYENMPSCVSYQLATEYSEFYHSRIPSIIEWEYAAIQNCGNEITETNSPTQKFINETAWTLSNANNKIHQTGSLNPGLAGIYDLFGNVWEMCNDSIKSSTITESTDENINIMSLGKNYSIAIRGGACNTSPNSINFNNQSFIDPSRAYKNIGFRIVK